jgi:hypothetical protein
MCWNSPVTNILQKHGSELIFTDILWQHVLELTCHEHSPEVWVGTHLHRYSPAAWVGTHLSRIFSSSLGWKSPVTNILQQPGLELTCHEYFPAAWVGSHLLRILSSSLWFRAHLARIFSSSMGWNSPVTSILQQPGLELTCLEYSPGSRRHSRQQPWQIVGIPKRPSRNMQMLVFSFSCLVAVRCVLYCLIMEIKGNLYVDFQTGGCIARLRLIVRDLADRLGYHSAFPFLLPASAYFQKIISQLPDFRDS